MFEGLDVDLRVANVETSERLVEFAGDADAILNPPYPTTARVFESLPSLSVVGVCGIGVDHVDLEAAATNDVRVLHVPDYCVEEVSTHAVTLLLSTVRRITTYDQTVRDGSWSWDIGEPIHRLRGQTFGFVGFGRIARRVAEKLEGFSFELLAYDPYLDEETAEAYGVRRVPFEELLEEATLFSIHAPLTDETAGLFDEEAFRSMDNEAVLINVSRGEIVDQDALHDAVSSGEIAGAGIDVLADEPPGESPLFELENVTLTPHAAWYSEEARAEVRRHAARDVRRVLEGEPPENPADTGSR
jgi:D-3-phosphoglycerate dehydrogenase